MNNINTKHILDSKEINDRKIQLLLEDLNEESTREVLKNIEGLIRMQKKAIEAKEKLKNDYLSRGTYIEKQVIKEGNRTKIIKIEKPLIRMDVKKRPRIVKQQGMGDNININTLIINRNNDEWMEKQDNKVRQMMAEAGIK